MKSLVANSRVWLVLCLFPALAPASAAVPPCQPGIGGTVYTTGQDAQVKIVLGNPSVGYTSDLYLQVGNQPPIYCGANKDYGATTTISNLAAGQEMLFYIYVRDTGNYFTIGDASRNLDGLAHANVLCGTNDSATIGFEDLYGGGDLSYNDLYFELRRLDTPARIAVPLQDQTVHLGATATFNVMASGTSPFSYQWMKAGKPLAGRTNSSLSLGNVRRTDEGLFSVAVSNAFGSTVSASVHLNVNLPPVANASATSAAIISRNGANASVILDASRSTDPDGAYLQFAWYEAGQQAALANGVLEAAALPLGTHHLLLVASDETSSNTNAFIVRVLTVKQAVQRLTNLVNDNVPHPNGLVATLSAAQASLDRNNLTPAANQLNAFENKVRAQVTSGDADLAAQLTAGAEDILDAIQNAPSKLKAIAPSPFQINLAWSDTSPAAIGYKIERATDGRNFTQIASVLHGTRTYQNRELVPDSAYSYRVRAYTAAGNLSFSSARSLRTLATGCSLSIAEWGATYGNPPGSLGTSPNPTTWAAIAAGASHGLALANDGTVVGWGDNTYGQIQTPANLTKVVAIAAGYYHSLALQADGHVVAWGNGTYGQLSVPPDLTGVVAIAAGGSHSLALKGDGTVVGWGDNGWGQTTIPPGLSAVVAIAAGGSHSLALRSDRTVVAWGHNDNGQATPPTNLTSAIELAAGDLHSLALKSDGTVIGWGDDHVLQATPPTNLTAVTAIAAGFFHSVALKGSHSVVDWGFYGAYGAAVAPQLQGSEAVAAGGDQDFALITSPAAPLALAVTITATNQVTLSWQGDHGGPDTFNIERALDNYPFGLGQWTPIGTVPDFTNRFTDSSVRTNLSYSYRVRAHNGCGYSLYSALVAISMTPPQAPNSLTAVVGLTRGIDLSWYDYSGNTAGFKLERATDSGGSPGTWTEIATLGVTNASAISYNSSDLNVTPGTGYWYRVRAFNPLGYSPSTDPIFLNLAPPSTPFGLSASAFADHVNLGWYDYYSGPFAFRIERAEDADGVPGSWQVIATNNALYSGSFFASDPARSLNVTYWYRVQAFNWVGQYPYTDPVSVTIVSPAAPNALSATLGSTNDIDLSWYENSADQDGFEIERAQDLAGLPGAWSQVASLSLSNTSFGYYSDTNVVAYSTNWYRVRAFNRLGYSDYSAPLSVKAVPPEAPSLFANVVANSVNLNWYASLATQGFKLERAPDAGGSPGAWRPIANLSPTYTTYGAYNDTGLAANTTYWYRVRSYNWVGNSPYSVALSITAIPPRAPTGLTAIIGTTNRVNLGWYQYPTDEDGFKIDRAADANGSPGTWTNLDTILIPNVGYATYTDTNVLANTTNWYRVRSFNVLGDSSNSVPAVVNVTSPPAPANIYGTPIANRINLYWYEYYSGEIGGYKLERAPDAGGQPGTWTQIANLIGNNNNYTDTGRAAGATYWYRVRAYTWVGDSDYSPATSIRIVPPAAPANLYAILGTTNQINLSWNDYYRDEDGFLIERALDAAGNPGTWTNLATLFATNAYYAYYTDTNVLAWTTNWYRVRAFNVVGISDYSLPAQVAAAPPPAPLYIYGYPFADRIILNWYESYTGDIGYKVERAPDAGGVPGAWAQIAQQGNYPSFTDTGRAADTTYWYRVRAYNWIGDTAYTDPVSIRIVPPGPPDAVAATLGTTNQVNLNWYDYYEDEDGFKVERAPDVAGAPGTWTEIATVFATNYYSIYYTDTNVLANTTNWYRVRAFNAVGISDYSYPASLAIVPPNTPFGVGTYVIAASRVDLYWSDTGNGIQGYKLERANDTNGVAGAWAQIALLSGYSTYHSDITVRSNRTYWYRVRAYNWIGDSAYSGPAEARTALPEAPANLTAVNDWRNQISLAWTAPSALSSLNGYRLERAPDDGGNPGTWSEIAVLSAASRSYMDMGLVTNKTYWYRLLDYNAVGNSAYTPPASALVRVGQFVRVMQWNVERNLGRIENNFSYAATSIASIVNYNQPDVLLFNEIDTQNLTASQNAAALINWVTNNVPYLGLQPGSTFYVAVSSQSDGFIRNAAISRFPLPATTTYNDGLRGLHSLRVQLSPANAIQIFHAHLKCCADDCARKQTEAQFDANVINAFAATNALPYIFAGDWNEEEERQPPVCALSDAYHPITTIRQGAQLAEFRPSTLDGEYRTWSSQDITPSIRFDYLLSASNRLTPLSGFVFSSTVWANHGVYNGNYYDSYYASDHYCVFANYLFRDPQLSVTPGTLTGSGYQGGPFSPPSQTYTLSNTTSAALDWTAGVAATWLSLSASAGTLPAGGATNIVLTLNSNASTLTPGTYQDTLAFTNVTAGSEVVTRAVMLNIDKPTRLVVSPAGNVAFTGPVGGSFLPAVANFTLSNPGITGLVWSATSTANWVTLSATNGALAAGAATNVAVSVNANANSFAAGNYSVTLAFTNLTDDVGDAARGVALSVTSFGIFDDFSTFTAGNLVGQRGWAQALAAASLPLKVVGGQVVLPSGQTADNQDAFKNFAATNGTLYYGFNLVISNAPASSSPSYFAALYTGNNVSGFANYRLSASDNGSGTFVLAARITGQAGDPYTFGTLGLPYGTPHRVIIEADSGGAFMTLYVDPTSPNVAEQAPYLFNGIGSGSPPPQSGSLVISQFGSGSSPNVGLALRRVAVSDDFGLAYNFLSGPSSPSSDADAPAKAITAAPPHSWAPRITSIVFAGNAVRLTWSTLAGLTNVVQTASTLTSGFADISPEITLRGAGETTATFTHAGAATNSPVQYYRIRATW